MNKLECQVTSCQHNCDDLCCLPGIQVDGPAAWESGQTCCASFEDRQPGSGTNSAGDRTPSEKTSISCQAEHCVYNENCKCEADFVSVGCGCSDVTTKSGTECCTFRPE